MSLDEDSDDESDSEDEETPKKVSIFCWLSFWN
jgi:hypothetical protein